MPTNKTGMQDTTNTRGNGLARITSISARRASISACMTERAVSASTVNAAIVLNVEGTLVRIHP
jgi:hypothetical protein